MSVNNRNALKYFSDQPKCRVYIITACTSLHVVFSQFILCVLIADSNQQVNMNEHFKDFC